MKYGALTHELNSELVNEGRTQSNPEYLQIPSDPLTAEPHLIQAPEFNLNSDARVSAG